MPPPPPLVTALQRMQESGYRLTRPRRAVAQALLEAQDWLRPEEVWARGRIHCQTLGLVTVYRTLAVLEDLGLARRIHLESGCHGYAPAGLQHGHHLVCLACHQVVEFKGGEDLAPLIRQISRKTGFVVEDHLLELTGRCPDCR
jgi:Fur family transcriptional regulator, ferric uptake regulator